MGTCKGAQRIYQNRVSGNFSGFSGSIAEKPVSLHGDVVVSDRSRQIKQKQDPVHANQIPHPDHCALSP